MEVCYETGRNGIGIEISEYWASIARQRLENVKSQIKMDKFVGARETKQIIIIGDSVIYTMIVMIVENTDMVTIMMVTL